jgi:PKD repeat protein
VTPRPRQKHPEEHVHTRRLTQWQTGCAAIALALGVVCLPACGSSGGSSSGGATGGSSSTVTAPTASFAYSPSSPAVNVSVQFTDTSTGSPTSWAWDFGDGATSTSQSPTHVYATAGSFTVTQTVRNSAGSNARTQAVTVTGRTIGLMINDSRAFDGYTLFAPKQNTMTYLINNDGRIVHQWTASKYSPGQSVYLLPNGHLLRSCMTKGTLSSGGGEGGRIEEYDWDDNLVWSTDWATDT